MSIPQLYRQLQTQLSQWIVPQDQRHLQGFCENVAAILQAQSACLSHWLPYLSHRDCQARSHMERLNYFATAEAVSQGMGRHGNATHPRYEYAVGPVLLD